MSFIIDEEPVLLWITANRYDYIPYQYILIPGYPGPPQHITINNTGAPDYHPILEWNSNPEPDIAGYNVYKNLTFENNVQTGFLLQNESLITDTYWLDETFFMSHQGNTRADYYVTAVDESQHESYPSEEVSTLGFSNYESLSPDDLVYIILKDYDGLYITPNPFNEKVDTKFVIAVTGKAEIAVYNLLGQRVITLFDGIAAGNQLYSLNYDAKDIASGIYICQLRSEDKWNNRKIILLK